MNDTSNTPPSSATPEKPESDMSSGGQRKARQAEALRRNLRRRKQQGTADNGQSAGKASDNHAG